MALDDKIKNAAQELKGKVEQAHGDASNDPERAEQGRRDEQAANLKQAGEHVKDAFR